MKYRFKRVFEDGTHDFIEDEPVKRSDAFTRAFRMCFSEEIDHVDLYNSRDKRIATFYK